VSDFLRLIEEVFLQHRVVVKMAGVMQKVYLNDLGAS
jgi:hypothetical protein